jgi:predicted membrane chloride channel (bestrophin family)
MRTKKIWIAATLAIVICLALILSLRAGEQIYEVRPEVSLPEYRTDAARAIDAYERLMDRHMDLMTDLLTQTKSDSGRVDARLASIDSKLSDLLSRTARIERALGIALPADQNCTPDPNGKIAAQP